MGGRWSECTLGDFVTLQRGHDLPDDRRQHGTVPVMGSFGVTGFHAVAKASGPGVTVGRSGASFGVVNYCPVDFWPLNTALYVVDFHGNHERFAYYFLRSLEFSGYNSGSAQPSLNRNFIHPIPVCIPPLPEQRAIAAILGTLDDKIELNRRTNETLEAMARALFKSWFVDFDPVRRNNARRRGGGQPSPPAPLPVGEGWPAGRGEGVAEGNAFDHLFPDSFVDSELGRIPKGWVVGTTDQIIAVSRDAISPQSSPDGIFDHYSLPAFDEGRRPAVDLGLRVPLKHSDNKRIYGFSFPDSVSEADVTEAPVTA